MSEPIIALAHVDKQLDGVHALCDLSLSFGRGASGLLGGMGAGKSALMRLLATLTRGHSGEAVVCGIPVEQADEIRPLIGYVPQGAALYPDMPADRALDYCAVLAGLSRKQRKRRIPEVLEQTGLRDCAEERVQLLSAEHQARLAIAQALLHGPKLLLLDEPFAGLDTEARLRLCALIRALGASITVLTATRESSAIAAIGGDFAVLERGKLVWHGSVAEFRAEAEGHVFQATVTKKDFAQIRAQHVLTRHEEREGAIRVRFVAEDTEFSGAAPQSPDMNDAYAYALMRHRTRFRPDAG